MKYKESTRSDFSEGVSGNQLHPKIVPLISSQTHHLYKAKVPFYVTVLGKGSHSNYAPLLAAAKGGPPLRAISDRMGTVI